MTLSATKSMHRIGHSDHSTKTTTPRPTGDLKRSVAEMQIRPATIEDAPQISDFVSSIAQKQIGPTLSDAGIRHLLAEMSTENQADRIRTGFQFFIAHEGDTIVGTVAIRLPCHLYYLFVHPDRQRQGIGRQLWNCARDWTTKSSNLDTFTVNSSLNAVATYKQLGFSITGPIEESHHVRYQPMRFSNATEQSDPPKSPVGREFES